MAEPIPYLSVVATSRNDDHGGRLLERMQVFVDGLIEQCRRHRLDAELVLVEWNPPADRPRLREALRWPADPGPCRIRIIEVPAEVHRGFRHSDRLPLFQMIAKNVGIRRARGRFVLATNIDLLFSDEIMAFLAAQSLEADRMYRVDRHDVMADVPVLSGLDEQLDYCRRHLLRVHRREGSFPVDALGRPAKPARRLTPLRILRAGLRRLQSQPRGPAPAPLHMNGCGDFTLLARERWFDLRGYPELHVFSFNLDSVLCHAAHHGGARELVLAEPMRVYHIEHAIGSGWTPEGHDTLFRAIEAKGIPWVDHDLLLAWAGQMNHLHAPMIFNGEGWGMAGAALSETTWPGGLSTTPVRSRPLPCEGVLSRQRSQGDAEVPPTPLIRDLISADRPLALDRPAPSPASSYYEQRHVIAATSERLRRMREAINDPVNLCSFQWAQWFAHVRQYEPDLVLELGRGEGNSTAAMNEALYQLGHGRLVSFDVLPTWDSKTVPLLEALVESDWFDRIDARVGNMLLEDFQEVIGSARRVLLIWDAHGFEIAALVLGHILPLLADREHIVIMHDISDMRYQDKSEMSYGGRELWQGMDFAHRNHQSARLQLGWISTVVDQAIAVVDFLTRNEGQLYSADESYHEEIGHDAGKLAEMQRVLTPDDWSLTAHWAFFSLNSLPGPYTFPQFVPPAGNRPRDRRDRIKFGESLEIQATRTIDLFNITLRRIARVLRRRMDL